MTKRCYLTPKQRKELHDKQSGLCADCGGSLGDRWAADHIHALALGGSNDLGNFQALCLGCHDTKTNGPAMTSYGSDKHAIAKILRLTGETPSQTTGTHAGKGRLQSRGFPKDGPKRAWPKRSMR